MVCQTSKMCSPATAHAQSSSRGDRGTLLKRFSHSWSNKKWLNAHHQKKSSPQRRPKNNHSVPDFVYVVFDDHEYDASGMFMLPDENDDYEFLMAPVAISIYTGSAEVSEEDSSQEGTSPSTGSTLSASFSLNKHDSIQENIPPSDAASEQSIDIAKSCNVKNPALQEKQQETVPTAVDSKVVESRKGGDGRVRLFLLIMAITCLFLVALYKHHPAPPSFLHQRSTPQTTPMECLHGSIMLFFSRI